MHVVESPPAGKSRYITGIWLQTEGVYSGVYFEVKPGAYLENKILYMYTGGTYDYDRDEFWSSGGGAPIKLEEGEELWIYSTKGYSTVTITGYDL